MKGLFIFAATYITYYLHMYEAKNWRTEQPNL